MGEGKRTAGRAPAILLVLGIALLPFFYVLSSGPALWLVVKTGLPAELWNLTYLPLTFARDVIPGFHELFQWYLQLWTG